VSWRTIKIKDDTKKKMDEKIEEMKLKGYNPSYNDLIESEVIEEEKKEGKEKDFMEIF